VDQVEWFGTTNHLCQAVKALRNKGSTQVMTILSNAPTFLSPGDTAPWDFMGFKGGREPGVFAGVFLLKSKTKGWGCASRVC
jgi:hypothetical protein